MVPPGGESGSDECCFKKFAHKFFRAVRGSCYHRNHVENRRFDTPKWLWGNLAIPTRLRSTTGTSRKFLSSLSAGTVPGIWLNHLQVKQKVQTVKSGPLLLEALSQGIAIWWITLSMRDLLLISQHSKVSECIHDCLFFLPADDSTRFLVPCRHSVNLKISSRFRS